MKAAIVIKAAIVAAVFAIGYFVGCNRIDADSYKIGYTQGLQDLKNDILDGRLGTAHEK